MIALDSTVIMSRAELDAMIRDAARAAAAEVAARVAAPAPQDELWTAAQVAAFLKVSDYTAGTEWPHLPGYPTAVRLGRGPRAQKRWYRKEIETWARDRQT